jgi:uncharacterized protein (UPF0261 family)
MMDHVILAVATMDTKGEEIGFVARILRDRGCAVRVVDVGTSGPPIGNPDVSRDVVAQRHPDGAAGVLGHTDRGRAVEAMGRALAGYLVDQVGSARVLGVIGIGGSGGTSLISRGMRALPIGVPKLLVSTVASGNTLPYVDCSDIMMMNAVVDVAGLNTVSRMVLSNAANAIAGAVLGHDAASSSGKAIGLTMFGVTTPCVDAVRHAFEAQGDECLVFHATGTGGRAMESLVANGQINRVIDLTTTEIADEVVGGVFPGGEHRLDAITRAGAPCVLSLGALDMVNFGSAATVPERFRDRNLYVHNPEVTLMRTNAQECAQIGQWMARKLNATTAPLVIVIPEGGLSLLDRAGGPFEDREANDALFSTLEQEVVQTDSRRIVRLPHNINDPAFAAEIVALAQGAFQKTGAAG